MTKHVNIALSLCVAQRCCNRDNWLLAVLISEGLLCILNYGLLYKISIHSLQQLGLLHLEVPSI